MIQEARNWIDAARRVVVLTGAGISTDSGIPDFRGPQGLWTKNPLAEKMSNIHYYLADREVRKLSWQNRMASPAWTAKPNAGHVALVELEKRRKLHALITQNIDELHQIAGNSPDKVIEVHGSMRRFMCWGCGMRGPMQLVLERVRAGEEDPPCRDCGGILKSDTISFGQQLVPEVIDRAMHVAAEGDVFLAVGSTLQVYPVAGAVDIARSAGAKIVIVNAQPTPYDDVAHAVLPGSISEVLPAILGSAARSLQ
ncbi:MAG TPA: NAD-dependent deacylase [Burkholderiales bacterium]